MNRKQRAAVAEQTVKICNDGRYTSPSGTTVHIKHEVRSAVESTVLYDLDDMPSRPAPRFDERAVISVTPESTFDALARLANDQEHLGCLNFASAKNPGGGFLGGSQAQEEALARASALYPCLRSQFSGYYEANRANSSSLYLDLLIASPNVPFFREDDNTLLEQPIMSTVLTAPAPNASAVAKNEPENRSKVEATLVRRAELILRAAAIHEIDTLVLGAWGCGVFGNDPSTVASVFQVWLGTDHEYERHFRNVVFAVYDPDDKKGNYSGFANVFGQSQLA